MSGKVNRQLKRSVTANFMALGEYLIIAIYCVSLTTARRIEPDVLVWQLALIAVVALGAHSLLMSFYSGGLRNSLASIISGTARTIGDEDGVLLESSRLWRALNSPLAETRLEQLPDGYWNIMVLSGLLPQIFMVAITGGMDGSPFAQLLMASVILGQFRASTGRAIWILFLAGVASALGAHSIFLWLSQDYVEAVVTLPFQARYFILPGFMVALASTVVYWVTFRLESNAPSSRGTVTEAGEEDAKA